MTIVQMVFIAAFVPTLVALAVVSMRVSKLNRMLQVAGHTIMLTANEVMRIHNEVEKLSTELSKYKKKVNN